jgi:diadenosine tetraphosphate (Ap4A) HIT family hydrolase
MIQLACHKVKCPFSLIKQSRLVFASKDAIVMLDQFPVSEGHMLVIPRKHVANIYELSSKHQATIWMAVMRARTIAIKKYAPAGFNIGFNDGKAAGQTVGHAHIHVIPRYAGDRPDPRGGVRWVLPDKAKYWRE